MGVYLPYIPRLPSEYQEVEYIQSTGTQWINSGVKVSNNTKIETKGYINDSNYVMMYGVYKVGYYISMSLLKFESTGNINYIGRMRSSSSGNSTVISSVVADATPHIFEQSQSDGLYIDGTKIGTFTSYTFTETYNLYIFAGNNYRDNVADRIGNTTIYYMKISEGGTLVRDFVPCYRKSDSAIGLYDLVNNQFYTNSGTGTFSKGNDVTMSELKNAYIGEYILKSYEEIIAMSAANATAELNTHPSDYYNKLNSEGHIYVSGTNNYIANQSGTSPYDFPGYLLVYYRTNTQVWAYAL